MQRLLICAVSLALGLGLSIAAMADNGPFQTPLKITGMYLKGGNGAVYVQFQNGSMPGCYANSGGYLFPTNQFYKDIYAQLLMAAAGTPLKVSVLYTKNTITNNWGDCTIDGLYLVE